MSSTKASSLTFVKMAEWHLLKGKQLQAMTLTSLLQRFDFFALATEKGEQVSNLIKCATDEFLRNSQQELWSGLEEKVEGMTRTELLETLQSSTPERTYYKTAYSNFVNRASKEFLNEFAKENGGIDWEKLVVFNSGVPQPRLKQSE